MKNANALFLRSGFFLLIGCLSLVALGAETAVPDSPRIVNLYNFIRNSDYRMANSEAIMFETTQKQIALFKKTGLHATWALQYDALIKPRYQKLLKEELGPKDEIALWWEIPQQLAEKAGLKWRGHHEWDPTANVGFGPGYTPEERRKLVDVYMADFKAIFGYYPKTAGSWYLDEVTLAHMVDQYGVIASCNCKDQIGTDGYTVWGGYWNQAYYPSRLNAYMPAQTRAGQIDVPIFRMLGSDPIYQYGAVHGMYTLEPVYSSIGGSPDWVAWFINNLVHEPALAFAYTQAGQENSFGWEAMRKGLTMQAGHLANLAKRGEIQIMTLAEAGKWFRSRYQLTPATAMVYLNDWRNERRKTVWYNSRFYRFNILWEKDSFCIRDIHRFDERVASVTHDAILTTTSLAYGTLPVMDRAMWSDGQQAGMWPVLLDADGKEAPMKPDYQPEVTELSESELKIEQTLQGGGVFTMVCDDGKVTCTGVDGQGKPLRWGMKLVGGERFKAAVKSVDTRGIAYEDSGVSYRLNLAPDGCTAVRLDNGSILLNPDRTGKLVLILDAK